MIKKTESQKDEEKGGINMSAVTLNVYDVVIMNSGEKSFIRTTVQAKTKVRAFMKALKDSKWKNVSPDDVTYHVEQITYFDIDK